MPDSHDIYDPNSVEMKMPQDGFVESEPETKQIPLMPIILFGVILILIGILGALLWWGSQFLTGPEVASPTPVATRPTAAENNEPESTNAEADLTVIQALSTSDEITAIEADLFGTDIEGLDPEITTLNQIFGE